MSSTLCCSKVFSLSLTLRQTRVIFQKRNGYIVLLPEINPSVPENIALLKDNMPDFSNLTTEKCVNTLGKHLLDLEQGIRVTEQALIKASCTDIVKEVIEPIEKLNAPLDSTWGIMKSLYLTSSQLMPASTFVPLHQRARKARSSKYYSKEIYKACKGSEQSNMTEEEQRVVDKYILEGRLAGLDLEENERRELANLHIKLAESNSEFEKRVVMSSKAFKHTIHDPNIIRDMPDYLIKMMAENKEDPSRGPWTVTLEPELYNLFLEYCPDRNLRWNTWQARTRVAAQTLENSQLRNSSTLEKIRALKLRQAQLLGYKSYADLSMATKMASSLEDLQGTLHDLLNVAKPVADKELVDLQQFAWDRGFQGTLEAWDINFWQRKQKRTLFKYQEELLNDYFPFDKVWSGLLEMCERVFGLKFIESDSIDKWHPDVRFFYIFEDSNKPVAGFFLDPYQRESKISSRSREGWIVNMTPAARVHTTLPLSTLILHLEPPIYGKPALLSWTDVQQLFKQFGHTLQQLLTTVNYADVAGLSNVEWDAVEIVGNVFLHLLKDEAVIYNISGHYGTGEKLPYLPLTEIDQHFAAYKLCEELFKANLDLELYSTKVFWQDILERLWKEHFMLPYDSWNSMPCSFTEIMTEQWGAAYYSHLWARIVAADVHSAFTEPDVDTSNIGSRFRDTYLSFGGSCHPGEVFRRFRGRNPSPHAFLKNLGLQ